MQELVTQDNLPAVLTAIAAIFAAVGGWGIFSARRELRSKGNPVTGPSMKQVLDSVRENGIEIRETRDTIVRIDERSRLLYEAVQRIESRM